MNPLFIPLWTAVILVLPQLINITFSIIVAVRQSRNHNETQIKLNKIETHTDGKLSDVLESNKNLFIEIANMKDKASDLKAMAEYNRGLHEQREK